MKGSRFTEEQITSLRNDNLQGHVLNTCLYPGD